LVVERIKGVGRDPTLINATVAEAQRLGQSTLKELESERSGLERELSRWQKEVRELLGQVTPNTIGSLSSNRLAELQERIRTSERRATEIREQAIALGRQLVDKREVTQAMSIFDPVWESLTPREQVRVVQLLVERVDYDATDGTVTISFYPAGIRTLADELTSEHLEAMV
jgi:site-specific DNA recombinase